VNKKNILRKNNLLIIILFIIGFILRIKPILTRPVIFDEAFTITYLIKYQKIIDIVHNDPSVPPLHYILIKLLSNFSTKIFWLRLPSLIYSMTSLLIIYKWIKSYSKKAAIYTLIFLTFSNFQITYSWQAYVYGQLFFFSLISLYSFYKCFYENNAKTENLIVFVISSLASWFTHYGYAWTLAGIAFIICYTLIQSKFKLEKNIKKTTYAFLVIIIGLILYSPIFLNKFWYAIKIVSWIPNINFFSFGKALLKLFGLDSHFDDEILDNKTVYFIFTLLYLFLYRVYFSLRNNLNIKEKSIFSFILTILMINTLAPLVFSLIIKQSIFAERSLIICSFLFTALVSLILSKLEKRKIFNLVLFIILTLFIFYTRKIDRNGIPFIFQSQEAAKNYAEWFRDNNQLNNKNVNILSFDSSSFYPYIDTTNFCSIDYYWYGYDGKEKLNKYKQITPENFYEYKNREFYIFVMLNPKNIDLGETNFFCDSPKFLYEAQKDSGLAIYKCN